MQDVFFQQVGAAHAFFFIHRQKGFQRAVRECLVFEGGQYQRNANAVISAQRRIFGKDEIVANDGFDRVF